MRTRFKNATEAFDYFYDQISDKGIDFAGTKALFNVGFTIENPWDNIITSYKRNFNQEYAEAEWKWYLTGDPNLDKLGEIYGKVPEIWKNMADWKNEVRSNYGWQWNREFQLDKVLQILRDNEQTRQATISIYDGKEIDTYRKDTPCTYAITFTIVEDALNMSVLMRSNDLWYGFCNDQYCFSMLQKKVAFELLLTVGEYYHHATNLHLYNNQLNK